jgi:hypothetical protein
MQEKRNLQIISHISHLHSFDRAISLQHRVFDMPELMIPPLDDCLSSEIATFLLWILELSHW